MPEHVHGASDAGSDDRLTGSRNEQSLHRRLNAQSSTREWLRGD